MGRTYNWEILQPGDLPLTPEGLRRPRTAHACTCTLIWPADQDPGDGQGLIVDPCFTPAGFRMARSRLRRLGISFDAIRFCHITHNHADHCPHFPARPAPFSWRMFRAKNKGELPGVSLTTCPGHHPFLNAVCFDSPSGRVWIVGDAVLNRDWLRAWGYYWPNGYTDAEITETFKSAARILAGARIIVPGHGRPISVTSRLLAELLASLKHSGHADRSPEIEARLRARLAGMRS